jgi:hypothetical protein
MSDKPCPACGLVVGHLSDCPVAAKQVEAILRNLIAELRDEHGVPYRGVCHRCDDFACHLIVMADHAEARLREATDK